MANIENVPQVVENARVQPGPQALNWFRLIQRWMQGEAIEDPPPPPADAPAEILAGFNEAIREQRNLIGIVAASKQNAIDYINSKTAGKIIDKNYTQYITALFNEYCDSVHLIDYRVRSRIIHEVIDEHIKWRLATPNFWNYDRICAASELNEMLAGQDNDAIWWNPFTWGRKINITTPGNAITPSARSRSYSWESLIGWTIASIFAATTAYAGYRLISNQFFTRAPTTITRSVAKQQLLRISTDTVPSFYQLIKLKMLRASIDILGDSCVIQTNGPMPSTAIQWSQPQSASFISRLLMSWNTVGR